MDPTSAKPVDAGTRLAVERTRLAYERTLMAWVRTATSLISFGFTIYKFFEFESGRGAVAPVASRLLSPRQFAMIMIATGSDRTGAGHARSPPEHQAYAERVRYKGRSVSMVVAAIVSIMGLAALLAASFSV